MGGVLEFKMATNLQKQIINQIMNIKTPVLLGNRPKQIECQCPTIRHQVVRGWVSCVFAKNSHEKKMKTISKAGTDFRVCIPPPQEKKVLRPLASRD